MKERLWRESPRKSELNVERLEHGSRVFTFRILPDEIFFRLDLILLRETAGLWSPSLML